jgi:hypothetical protein
LSTRFAQLPIGAQFRWQDRRWRRVSPLEATDMQTHERRLVPRSAKVTLLDGQSAEPQGPNRPPIDSGAVEVAIDHCLEELRRRIPEVVQALDADQRAALDSVLRRARDTLFDRLAVAAIHQPTGNSADTPGTR